MYPTSLEVAFEGSLQPFPNKKKLVIGYTSSLQSLEMHDGNMNQDESTLHKHKNK